LRIKSQDGVLLRTMTDDETYEKLRAERERMCSWLRDQEYINDVNDGYSISFKIGNVLCYQIDHDTYLHRSEIHTKLIAGHYPNIITEMMVHLPPVSREEDVDSVLDELPDQFSWFDGTRRGFGLKQLDDHHLPHIAIIDDVDRVDVDDAEAAISVALDYYEQFCHEEDD